MKIVHNQQQRIAIVGGGLAGLHAAWRLEQRGMDFELFEARSRWGGRILGTDDGGVDLGPTWFWPGFQPRITRLLEELQMPVFPQYQSGYPINVSTAESCGPVISAPLALILYSHSDPLRHSPRLMR